MTTQPAPTMRELQERRRRVYKAAAGGATAQLYHFARIDPVVETVDLLLALVEARGAAIEAALEFLGEPPPADKVGPYYDTVRSLIAALTEARAPAIADMIG